MPAEAPVWQGMSRVHACRWPACRYCWSPGGSAPCSEAASAIASACVVAARWRCQAGSPGLAKAHSCGYTEAIYSGERNSDCAAAQLGCAGPQGLASDYRQGGKGLLAMS